MHKRIAIASPIKEPHRRQVEALWEGLAGKLGLALPAVRPVPSFTYQVAEDYTRRELQEVLAKVASRHRPFKVSTATLTLVQHPRPALALTLVRDHELLHLHQALYDATFMIGHGLEAGYHPDEWHPHVPLTFGDLSREAMARVGAALAGRELAWELAVDQVIVVEHEGDRAIRRYRFELQGR